jgi:two-component system, chemotaxis family, sensor kinase Cph1
MVPEIKTKFEISSQELTECDRCALHLVGKIQGNCGHCLFVDYPAWTVIAVDANILDLKFIITRLHKDVTKVRNFIGSLLKECIPNELFDQLNENVHKLMTAKSSKSYLFYEYQNCAFAISISACSLQYSTLAFEIEVLNTDIESSKVFQTYVNLSSLMESYSGENVVEIACDRIFDLFGQYDRGMVYRFNDDDSGEVIHEIKRDHIVTSYLGLRFPSSDIPKPARDLYFINRVRYVHNNELDPIQIIACDNITIDQSLCHMRAVAKPHVVYLKQMGVVSSMSMAIIVDETLWGLLSFHAYTDPCKPTLQQRLACESIGAMVSIRLEAAMKKIEYSRSLLLGQQISQLDKKKCVNQNISDWGIALLGIIKADIFVGYTENSKEGELEYIRLWEQSQLSRNRSWAIYLC